MPKQKNRNVLIDICRFYGILFVVIGHSGCPYQLNRFIYLFHMALFFVLSGACYSEKNDDAPIAYVQKKITGIYIPYVLFTMLMAFCHNFFISTNLYASNPLFLNLEIGNKYGLLSRYSIKDLAIQILRILLFAGDEEFGGATWFLRILFATSILHCFFRFFIKKLFSKAEHVRWINTIFAFLMLLIGWIFDYQNIHLPLELQTTFSAYYPFALGFLFKGFFSEDKVEKRSWVIRVVVVCVSVAVMIAMSKYKSIGLGLNSIIDPLFYTLATVLGTVFVYELSAFTRIGVFQRNNQIYNAVERMILYCAKHSMSIVFWHFVGLKLFTIIYVFSTGKDLIYLGCFPVAVNTGLFWIPYTVFGMAIPVLLALLYEKIIVICRMKVNQHG